MALGVRTYPIMSKPGQKLLDRNKPRDFVEVLKKANLDENVRRRPSQLRYLMRLLMVWVLGSGSLVAR